MAERPGRRLLKQPKGEVVTGTGLTPKRFWGTTGFGGLCPEKDEGKTVV